MSDDPTYDFLASGGNTQTSGSGDPTYDFLASGGGEQSVRPTMPDGRLLGESRKGAGDYNPSIAEGDKHILSTLADSKDNTKDTGFGQMVSGTVAGLAKPIAGLAGAASLPFVGVDKSADIINRVESAVAPPANQGTNAGPMLGIPGMPTSRQFLQQPANPLNWPSDVGKGVTLGLNKAGAAPEVSQGAGDFVAQGAPWALGLLKAPGEAESMVEPDTGPEGQVSLEPPTKAHGPSVSDQILADSRKAGYVVPPATTNPSIVNRVVEGFAGKASVAQAAAIKNQPITDGLARSALNLPPDAELTPETMDAVRAPAGQVYAQVAGSGRISIDPQYQADLSKITEASNTIKGDLPNYSSGAQDEIQNLVKSIIPENGTMDATTAVALSKDLRKNANANYSMAARTGDSTRTDIARAQQAAAGAVEDQVERHLTAQGQLDLATDWDNARTTIAKSYTVQNALDGAGHVDATKLGKQLLKGKPLSDELETAANFANAFPKAARVAPGKESMPGMSPLDVYGSVAASLGTGSPLPMLLGPGRMAARSMALSKPFQPSE